MCIPMVQPHGACRVRWPVIPHATLRSLPKPSDGQPPEDAGTFVCQQPRPWPVSTAYSRALQRPASTATPATLAAPAPQLLQIHAHSPQDPPVVVREELAWGRGRGRGRVQSTGHGQSEVARQQGAHIIITQELYGHLPNAPASLPGSAGAHRLTTANLHSARRENTARTRHRLTHRPLLIPTPGAFPPSRPPPAPNQHDRLLRLQETASPTHPPCTHTYPGTRLWY